MSEFWWRVIPIRLRLAWHCLRGWPVGYRITLEDGGFVITGRNALIVECAVIRTPSGTAYIVRPRE